MLKNCKICKSGSCCQEGVEVTEEEMLRIEKLNPAVEKPWFKLIDPNDAPDPGYNHETIVRNGRCVFQRDDKLCSVYSVRPQNCADFPLELGKPALYYERLCDNRPAIESKPRIKKDIL